MNMDVILGGLLNESINYEYEDDYYYEGDFESKGNEAVMIPVLYSLVLVVGLPGNLLLLAILWQKRRSWRMSDTFVLHLGVADILLLLTLPLWAVQAARRNGWCFGVPLCKISGAVFNINFYCGIFLLVCISLDLCLSIVKSTQLYFQKKPALAHMSCLFVWFISLLLTIPNLFFLNAGKDVAQEKTLCVHKYSQSATDWQLVSRLIHHTLGFLLPAASVIVCCSSILLRLQCSPKRLQKQRAVMIILPSVTVFFLCWIPYNITLIVDTYRNTTYRNGSLSRNPEGSLKTALMVTSALGCVHACLRPLLYFGLCGNFRKQTLAMLRCATHESKGSLWELGVGEEALPDQSHEGEELKQLNVGHEVQFTTSTDEQTKMNSCDSYVI